MTGSSRGLGADIARRLARDGLAVAVNGLHDESSARDVVAGIHADGGVAEAFPRSAYAAAKSAQIGLTRAWARELAPLGITVNTVAPGFVPVERHADVPDDIRRAYVASVPAGRFGTLDDIASAVSFFASDEAAFVTGQRLVVDGGRGLSG